MKLRFEEDEYFLMAMFQKENRMKTMQEIRRIFSFIKEDAEMLSLVNGTLSKMERLTDQEFLAMDFEEYRQEIMEEL